MSVQAARVLLMLGAFLAGLVLLTAVTFIVTGRSPAPLPPAASAIGGPFELVSHQGKTITEQDFKGKPFLVFFGFTHCPDICPTTLFEISEILRAMGNDGDRVGVLFVTVDPERDTPDLMRDYLSSFDPRVVGGTGDAEAIRKVEKTYRAYSKQIPLKEGGYTMDHSTVVYLMDREGRFVAPFNINRPPEQAAKDLRRYL